MAGPYPLATLAAQVTPTGISAPSYSDILASLQASYQTIYGSDVYLGDDSQDGQLLAIFAKAINDSNSLAIAIYNSFSPATAMGAGLSSVVKINGLEREEGSNSSVDVTLVGVAGTLITNGLVGDQLFNQWALPTPVTIPGGGSIVVTAIAVNPGAITAEPATVVNILTPTLGWQSVNNVGAATPGAIVEADATLRARQSVSTSLPGQSILDGIIGAVGDLIGVQLLKAYENDTGVADANGLPAHSISLVVEGGDSVQIATTISLKKTPGTATYGTTLEVIIDPEGVPSQIRFYRPTVKRIVLNVTIKALTGYVSTTGDALLAALATYVSGLGIGEDILTNRVIAATNIGQPLFNTFEVTALTMCIFGGSPTTADILIAFNELANLAVSDIALTTI